ncbi:MAG: hypothetical protein Q9183_005669, partial [Haloplaca sp. 2 TL-2023]
KSTYRSQKIPHPVRSLCRSQMPKMSTSLLVSSIVDTESYDDDQLIEVIDRDPYANEASLSDLIVPFTHQFSTKSRILANLLGILATRRWSGKGLLISTIISAFLQAVEEKRNIRLEREKEAAEEKEKDNMETEKQREEV